MRLMISRQEMNDSGIKKDQNVTGPLGERASGLEMSKALSKVSLGFFVTIGLIACSDLPVQFDSVISNGKLVDGLGGSARAADVYLKDGVIAAITAPGELDAAVTNIIDATGKIIAPGFIDVHSHGDPLETPDFENFLAQGVTTITLGQDGVSQIVVVMPVSIFTFRFNTTQKKIREREEKRAYLSELRSRHVFSCTCPSGSGLVLRGICALISFGPNELNGGLIQLLNQ